MPINENERPFAPACERNKDAILHVLKQVITGDDQHLLEIGAGTGQHAVSIAPHFLHLKWHVSDVLESHSGIKMWLDDYKEDNIVSPVEYELGKNSFPQGNFNLVYCANVIHIMAWKKDKTLFRHLGENLNDGAQVIYYGPFNYNGKFTSDSNEKFDLWLKQRDSLSGVRNFEDVERGMNKNSFDLTQDFEMPANNRILLFTKIAKMSSKK